MAMELLVAREQGNEPLEQSMAAKAGDFAALDPRDAQLAKAILMGVLRWQGYLDGIIRRFSKHPLEKMKPLTLAALRIGLYQLLFLDRIPPSAAVNETVQALKLAGQPKWLTGFVNGVLRSLIRARKSLPPADEAAAVASHPAWLVERWRQQYGEERAGKICAVNNIPPPLGLWVNPARISVAGCLALLRENEVAAEPGQFAPDSVLIEDFRGRVAELPGYREGFFQVQDEAAQLVCRLLAPLAPGDYLDACAGLGGKSIHLASLLPPEARLTAVEPNRGRAALFAENLRRLGGPGISLYQGSLQEYGQGCGTQFKGILVDAPCSGLGVIRRHPEIRWNRRETDLCRYRAQQEELLATAAGLLAPGGALVYATCSLAIEENEEVIAGFLKARPDFSLSPARKHLPAQAGHFCDAGGFFKTAPDQGLDGFFAARLEKAM